MIATIGSPLYTPELQAALKKAGELAETYESDCVTTLHILIAILYNRNIRTTHILERHHVSIPNIASETSAFDKKRSVEVNDILDTHYLQTSLHFAQDLVRAFAHKKMRTEHLLSAILCVPKCLAYRSLEHLDVDIPSLRSSLIVVLKSYAQDSEQEVSTRIHEPRSVEISDRLRTNKALEIIAAVRPNLLLAAAALEQAMLDDESSNLDFICAKKAFRELIAGLDLI